MNIIIVVVVVAVVVLVKTGFDCGFLFFPLVSVSSSSSSVGDGGGVARVGEYKKGMKNKKIKKTDNFFFSFSILTRIFHIYSFEKSMNLIYLTSHTSFHPLYPYLYRHTQNTH